MEKENAVPLLSPPKDGSLDLPSEAAELLWEDTLAPTSAETTPSDTADIEETTQPPVTEIPPQEEILASVPEDGTAETEYGESKNPLRFVLRTGMILLGLFSAVILAVTVIDGIEGLTERGLDKLILGELFGGDANISILPHETEGTPLKEPMNLSSLPANEQENLTDEAAPPLQSIENGAITVVSADLSAKGEHGLGLINETPYTPALLPYSDRAIPALSELYAEYGTDAPVVLILHTHATESFSEDGAESASESDWRSSDTEENMVAVGKVLAEVLRSRGINVIHCEEMFDAEDFTMAYYNASLTIRRILAEYPSVSYILDLHRDSISYANGAQTIRPVTVIDGEAYAQMMFVVGTDHGGSGHTGWTDNFNLACRLQSRITEEYGPLMRSVNLRSASFNQQYTKGSLLIEMGAAGSSIEEACRSAEILGNVLAEEIIGPKEESKYLLKGGDAPLIRQTSGDPLPQGS